MMYEFYAKEVSSKCMINVISALPWKIKKNRRYSGSSSGPKQLQSESFMGNKGEPHGGYGQRNAIFGI